MGRRVVITQPRHAEIWLERYPARASQFCDTDRRPPEHTFFYPVEEYRPDLLDRVAALCEQDVGEVEVPLHHDTDTAIRLKDLLDQFARTLHDRHGLLPRDASGRIRYGFVRW